MLAILEAKQWLVWDLVDGRKLLFDIYGERVGSTSKYAYATYQECHGAAEMMFKMGPAFCFTEEDPWLGIDLDDCLVDYRTPKNWVVPILDRFRGSYVEVSPSLKGVKIWVRATKLGSRCRADVEDGAIEIYDRGRFFAFTGVPLAGYESDEIADAQDAVDWLVREYLPTESPGVRGELILVGEGLPVDDRAARYLDNIERPAVGGRNLAVFKAAGHLRSFGLPETQVLAMIAAWNATFFEPLAEKEVESAVRSSFRNGTPREDKSESGFRDVPGIAVPDWAKPDAMSKPAIDVRGETDIEEDPFAADERRMLAEALRGLRPTKEDAIPRELWDVPGFIGDFVRYCMRTCFLEQPSIFLAAGIALQGVLAGRKVCDDFGNETNVYALALAPSTSGKDHARRVANKLLMAIGAYESLANLESVKSGQAIVRSLSVWPAKLAMIDEFGRFMRFNRAANASGFVSEIGDVLLKLYSSAGVMFSAAQYADAEKNVTIDRPSFSLFATTVGDSFWHSMTTEQMTDGLLGRFLIFHGDDNPPMGPMLPTSIIDPELLDHARGWNERGGNLAGTQVAPPAEVLPTSDDARERIREIFRECHDARSGMSGVDFALLGRLGEITARLSVIYAASRSYEAPVIDIVAVEWAYALARGLAASLARQAQSQIIEGEYHRASRRILAWIAEAGSRGRTLRQVGIRWTSIKIRDRKEILADLIESGFLAVETVKLGSGAGRPTTIFRIAEAGMDALKEHGYVEEK